MSNRTVVTDVSDRPSSEQALGAWHATGCLSLGPFNPAVNRDEADLHDAQIEDQGTRDHPEIAARMRYAAVPGYPSAVTEMELPTLAPGEIRSWLVDLDLGLSPGDVDDRRSPARNWRCFPTTSAAGCPVRAGTRPPAIRTVPRRLREILGELLGEPPAAVRFRGRSWQARARFRG